MKPCPFCGTSLTDALVASILDPKQEDEWCPRKPPKRTLKLPEPSASVLAAAAGR